MRIGVPRDAAQWAALALAFIALAALPKILAASSARRRAVVIGALAAIASALSAAYVVVYLRGGPRIIDATSYYLEARALAHGLFAWRLPEPAASILGRFLVRGSDGKIAVIFPPGYPALLAIGFKLGAPLAIGPVLAAALVVATAALATRVLRRDDAASAIDVPIVAGLFSVVCAALRYHTADTMSHGLAALCFASTLALVLAAIDAVDGSARRARGLALLGGLFAGWLLATRPVSAIALALALALALGRAETPSRAERIRIAVAIAIGALPGAALLIAHQRAATGGFGASSQSLYYALSDGPPGCFGYGFGRSIGCLGEHGDFVHARLADGYGALAALGTTLRRLWLHMVDVANAEPLALLVPFGAWVSRRSPRARLLTACVGLQIAAYAPFYFDGNYPGGGARFFADVLPLEHVLAALAVAEIARRATAPGSAARRAAAVIALACTGFAVRAGFDHALLRDREGGLPMFEPTRLAEAGVTQGLVFVTTDHAFNLAYDPAGSGAIDFLRLRGDGLDTLAWEARGRPEAYVYDFAIPPDDGPASISIHPLALGSNDGAPLSIEGESLWPVARQEQAWALAEFASGTCASKGRWLRVRRADGVASGRVEVALPASLLRGRVLSVRVAESRAAIGSVRVGGRELAPAPGIGGLCRSLEPFVVPPDATDLRLTVEVSADPSDLFALDGILVAPK